MLYAMRLFRCSSLVKAFAPLAALATVVGCGGGVSASALRGPLEQRCAAAGLAGCPALAQGVVQYVEKNRSAASRSLQLAADVNDPEKLRAFVTAEKVTAASDPSETSLEVTSALGVLQNLSGSPASITTTSAAPVKDEATKTAVRSGTVLAAATGGQACKMKRGSGTCMQRRAVLGPITITDIESPGGCADELRVFVGEAYDPEWVVSSTSRLATHGASYVVGDSQTLWVAAVAKPGGTLSTSDACAVTWRGSR